MHALIEAIDRFLNALGRTPGEEFANGLYVYRLIEHRRELRPPRRAASGQDDEYLQRAS